jgi:hypothetical protein
MCRAVRAGDLVINFLPLGGIAACNRFGNGSATGSLAYEQDYPIDSEERGCDERIGEELREWCLKKEADQTGRNGAGDQQPRRTAVRIGVDPPGHGCDEKTHE